MAKKPRGKITTRSITPSKSKLHHTPPSGAALVGVARRDITPPVGIYARMWGAASHDVSEGTHQPLSVTSMVIRQSARSEPMVLIAIDIALLGDLGGTEDQELVLGPTAAKLGIDMRRFIVNCSHTHSAPWASMARSHMPGGEMIEPYLRHLGSAILEATREALATVTPATFTWATGRCSLATHRDLPDPDPKQKRTICGFNPDVPADDTVIVGRVTRDSDDRVLATVVNYACHPTTLAWLNRVISPDYIGSMREVVETHTNDAPCLFLQGASGELAPAHQYVGDVAVAEKHGRQLGFAALSAFESMLPPRQRLAYKGVMESGAPLAVWWPEPFKPSREIEGGCFDVPLPVRDMPSAEELERQIEKTTDRALRERLFRKLRIVKALGGGKTHNMPAWVWRIGGALIIGHANEAYSCFQTELREAFPDYAVVVMNVCGAEMGYITPAPLYSQNVYQVWQTPFDKGSLRTLTNACLKAARKVTANGEANGKPKASRKPKRTASR